MNKKIVISGVNMVEGGILTILQSFLKELSQWEDIEVYALVHSKKLFNTSEDYKNIKFLEFKNIKNSWISRLKFEWVDVKKICNELQPDVWVSLHDMSVNVTAPKKYVYCHNPSPFYKSKIKDLFQDKKFFLFTIFYKYLYGINIKKNTNVIVQQNWIADEFSNMYNINNLLVARPETTQEDSYTERKDRYVDKVGKAILLYPAIPRVFKNFEVIINAVNYIKKEFNEDYKNIEILLTFSHGFNKFGDNIINVVKEKNLDVIKFIGYKNKDEINDLYEMASALIFPSKLETWGLPLSEAKAHNIPVMSSNLPYAKETIGNYNKCIFFEPDDYIELANLIVNEARQKNQYQCAEYSTKSRWPVIEGWHELVKYII